MAGFGVVASELRAKVVIGARGDTIYPPVPPSPARSEVSDRSSEMTLIYTPLKQDEIRLLILNPGSGGEPISCFLENYAVAKPKRFAALSYVWGHDTPDTRRRILLDGCPVDVTANLYAFLAQHRAEDTCGILWVDALCINQDDLVERGAQIRLMKRIYESAERVVIWLGESNPAVDAAVVRMLHIYNSWWPPILRRTGSAPGSLATITKADTDRLLRGPGSKGGTSNPALDNWKAGIHDVLSRPWWSRIWVYQEATAPCQSGAQVHIGPHRMPLDAVLTVHQIIRSIARHGNHPDPLFSLSRDRPGTVHPATCMQTYTALRKRYHDTGRTRFLRLPDLLSALRRFDATNPRDKLYALIPTSLDGAELLDVAYDRPVQQVYAEAAWSMIRAHRSLDVLGHCSPPPLSPDDGTALPGLPSWVPNWMAKPAAAPLFKRGVTALRPRGPNEPDAYDGVHVDDTAVEIGKLYAAAGDSVPEASVDASGRVLSCAGFVFDRVGHVSPEAGVDLGAEEVGRGWAAWLRTVPKAQTRRATLEEEEGALARIAVADCDRVAIDVGMRRGRGRPGGGEAAGESVRRRNYYYMDITGPHPAAFHRRLVVTEKGYLGLVPEHVRMDDLVAIVMGSQVPLVLREVQGGYQFVGEAFVDGIMDGEALAERKEDEGSVLFRIL